MSTATDETYQFTPGEQVTFYLVDPATQRGGPPRQGTVVEEGATQIVVLAEDGTIHSIKHAQTWNQASQEHFVRSIIEEVSA